MDFINDAVGNPTQQFVRQLRPISGHEIIRSDRAQGDGFVVGALIAHHPHRAHGKQGGEGLRQARLTRLRFSIEQAGVFQFRGKDEVGLLQAQYPLRGDLTQAAYCQTGAREGLAP